MAVIDPQASEPESKGEDDHTIVVDRTAPGVSQDDHTVLVDRIAPGEEQTDLTIVVDRSVRAKPGTSKDRTARKRRIAPPPVPSGFAPQAVTAAGADAREHYPPRTIPATPTPAPDSEAGPAATREASATMPSVARNSRVAARAAVVVFVASCVVSAVGLTLIAFALVARF